MIPLATRKLILSNDQSHLECLTREWIGRWRDNARFEIPMRHAIMLFEMNIHLNTATSTLSCIFGSTECASCVFDPRKAWRGGSASLVMFKTNRNGAYSSRYLDVASRANDCAPVAVEPLQGYDSMEQ